MRGRSFRNVKTNEIEKNESALEDPFLVLIVCLRVHVKQSTALL
jgi:hypothetical protein